MKYFYKTIKGKRYCTVCEREIEYKEHECHRIEAIFRHRTRQQLFKEVQYEDR
jgi:hypothetical protein